MSGPVRASQRCFGRWRLNEVISAALSDALCAAVRFLLRSGGLAIVVAAHWVRLIGVCAGRVCFSIRAFGAWARGSAASAFGFAALIGGCPSAFPAGGLWQRSGASALMAFGLVASSSVVRGSADQRPAALCCLSIAPKGTVSRSVWHAARTPNVNHGKVGKSIESTS